MARLARFGLGTVRVLLMLALVAVALVLFLDRSRTSERWARGLVESALEGVFRGSVQVDDLRAGSLLSGARLYGVRVVGDEGREAFRADSVHARYSIMSFLSGGADFSNVVIWGARVTISRYPNENEFNVQRLLARDREDAGPAATVVFRGLDLHDAGVEVLYADSSGVDPVRIEGVDADLRRLRFDSLQARLGRVVLSSPSRTPHADVRSLEFTGHLSDTPLRLNDFDGRIAWSSAALDVEGDVRLGSSPLEADIAMDLAPDSADLGWIVDMAFEADEFALAELGWLLNLPEARLTGDVAVTVDSELATRVSTERAALEAGDTRVVAAGALTYRGALAYEDLALTLEPLTLARVEALTGEALPLDGTLVGTLTVDGPGRGFLARGSLTHQSGSGGLASRIEGSAIVDPEGARMSALDVTLDPFDIGLVRRFVPGFALRGPATARLEGGGSLSDGLRIQGRVTHRPPGLPRSRVVGEANFRRGDGGLRLDVFADASPLSVTTLAAAYEELSGLRGEVTGWIQLDGTTDELDVRTNFEVAGGIVDLAGVLRPADSVPSYRFQGSAASVDLNRLDARLPAPTRLWGVLRAEGHGVSPESLRLEGRLHGVRGLVGNLALDTAAVTFGWADDRIRVDTLDARVAATAVNGSGTLGLKDDLGQLELSFATDSLVHLRPLWRPGNVVARDTLSSIELDLLAAEDVDPDTLPELADVRVSGSASGAVTLSGALERLRAVGSARLDSVRVGTNGVREATATFEVQRNEDGTLRTDAVVDADSLGIVGRVFSAASLDLAYTRGGSGQGSVSLSRSESERYSAAAEFALDSAGGHVAIEQLELRFDSVVWSNPSPARISWSEEGVTFEEIELTSSLAGGMRVTADGVLPRRGTADLAVDVTNLPLDRVAEVLQLDGPEVRGWADGRLRMSGTAADPVVDGRLAFRDVEIDRISVGSIATPVQLARRRLAFDLAVGETADPLLAIGGTIPVELQLRERFGIAFPDEPVDLNVAADSLPVALALGFLEDLDDVEGRIDGSFDVGGTLDGPAPDGRLEISDAAWTVAPMGVRHRSIAGSLVLSPDGTVTVDARGGRSGSAVVTGTVELAPLSNPVLSLEARFQDFRVVDRSDVTGIVDGRLVLEGRFRSPSMRGELTVREGVLALEEFQRASTVVDLSDPRFFDIVDTTLVSTRAFLRESQNPFLDSLRVDIGVTVSSNSWLRSELMNVEMTGRIDVTYDRPARDLVLVGQLNAVRGSRTVLGRRFDVESGTVSFVGTPGLNPNLDIRAVTRVRRSDGEPLDVQATVTGTLADPRLQLSSDEQALAEADLVSYLVFGRPSHELASGQAQALEGTGILGAGVDATFSFLSGTLATRLGALAAEQWGLDYFSINQLGTISGGALGSVAQTQVEVGRYIGDDLFWVLVLQPITAFRSANLLQTFGVRLEWTAPEDYTVQAFWEDRFLRSASFGFQELGFTTSKILGFSLFWEWSY